VLSLDHSLLGQESRQIRSDHRRDVGVVLFGEARHQVALPTTHLGSTPFERCQVIANGIFALETLQFGCDQLRVKQPFLDPLPYRCVEEVGLHREAWAPMSVAVGLIAAVERAVRAMRDCLEMPSAVTTDGVAAAEQCRFGVAIIADALFLINSETSHDSSGELGRNQRWRDAG
jgi:hypothetical protein